MGCRSLDALAAALKKPRVVWMMVPAAVVEQTVDDLSHLFEPGDIIIDGGNSHYIDDIRRAKRWPRKAFITWMPARAAASGGSSAATA